MLNATRLQCSRILTPSSLATQVQGLIAIAPVFADVFAVTGLPELRLRDNDFTQLYRTIVSQQLSVAAASSIWKRLSAASLVTPKAIKAASDSQLRLCGLSSQKIRYVRSLVSHRIDFAELASLDDEAVIAQLTAVTGIGRWTAEIYLLFSLNRPDVMAANDLALQVAAQHCLSLKTRPKESQLREIAEDWQPHRSAACYLLWSYYHEIKSRQALPA